MKHAPDIPTLAGYLDELEALTDQNEDAAARHGDELTELAARLPRQHRRFLLAGVDLILAEMLVGGPRWPEAAERIRRSRKDIERELPDAVAEMTAIMARVAVREERLDEAHAYWTRARELLERDGRWGMAGAAAAALAELVEDDDRGQAAALYRTAADHLAKGDLAEDARYCASKACELVIHAIRHSMRPGQEAECFERAVSTRELGLRHGVTESVAELACFAGTMSSDSPRPWLEIAEWFATARREYSALTDVDPRAIRINLAWIDCCEGFAAISRHRPLAAEPLLRAALEVYRQEDMTEGIEHCEMLLVSIIAHTEPDLVRADRAVVNQRWGDSEASLAASMARAFSLLQQQRWSEATAAIAEARRLAVAAGVPHKAVALDAFAAAGALIQGDPAPAQRSVREMERYLAENDATLPRTGADLLAYLALTLRALLASAAGDGRANVTHLRRLESLLLSRGAGLFAARMALLRAEAELRSGQPANALQTALPAAIALDAVRFCLADADRRRRWNEQARGGFEVALRAAAATGDARVIAELIEVARGNAVPVARNEDSDAVAALGALLAEPMDPVATSAPLAGVLSGPDALAGGENCTALGLPARVRTPWGTIALAEYLELAGRYYSPVRADVTVDWRLA